MKSRNHIHAQIHIHVRACAHAHTHAVMTWVQVVVSGAVDCRDHNVPIGLRQAMLHPAHELPTVANCRRARHGLYVWPASAWLMHLPSERLPMCARVQLDFLEHPAITDVIVCSVVLEEVRHKNTAAYQRLRALCASDAKRFFVFANEHHRYVTQGGRWGGAGAAGAAGAFASAILLLLRSLGSAAAVQCACSSCVALHPSI